MAATRTTTATSLQSEQATYFRSLHKPGSPIILANVYDPPSARAVATLPTCKAMATASYSIAEAAGLTDPELTKSVNLDAVKIIAKVAREHHKPLTADIQGGYGDELEDTIRTLISYGVVGCNLEDVDEKTGQIYGVDVAVERVRRAVRTATSAGVPDFVVNARVDALLFGGDVKDAIARGKQYLDAGAVTAFVWGGRARPGISRDEVVQLVQGLQGRLNVSMKIAPGYLTAKELAEIGVARISVGPQLQLHAMEALRQKAEEVLGGMS